MERYIDWIIRHRYAVIVLTLLVTALALFQARSIKIIIDPGKMMPQSHPYVATSTTVEKVFGSKHVVVVGIRPREGDVYQPAVLAKVQHMTAAFERLPGVVKENMLSLAAKRAKNIQGDAEGLRVKPLMEGIPSTQAQLDALRRAVETNPVYRNAVVSADGKTTAIFVEFRDATGYRAIMDLVEPIVDRERDARVEIALGGLPHFLAKVEGYSERMGIFLPIAIVILCLVLFEAFRTKQGLILPLLTAVLAVIWGIGAMGASGMTMDVFNSTTPILILAVATGHAVQLLKRYYEEYYRLREQSQVAPRQANVQAVAASLKKVGPVMIAAGTVASLGFFSLVIFEINTVRTFGIFTGLGILAALILEMSFIPALRSVLPPPADRTPAARTVRIWGRITGRIADVVTGPARSRVYAGVAAFAMLALAGTGFIVEDNSVKRYFASNLPFQRDDQVLNDSLGGTNTLFLLVEGASADAIKQPQTLQAMADMQDFLMRQPSVGKTISMADFIRRMNQAMHGDDPTFYTIPENQELVSQYLLLYSMSGDPGDFDAYVDYDYRRAKIAALIKTDSTANAEALTAKVKAYAARRFPAGVKVHIGGSAPQDAALNDAMVKGKILNIVQIAAVVFLISSLVFRSFAAGALVLLPLLLAVLANFGLMGWSGILLNIPTSLTSAMAVGIGADYAIYLIYRLREELAIEKDENVAVRHVLATAGEAILFVAVAVACGYGVLLLSVGFYIHVWLAILIAAAMLVSALAALLLIPSLILTLRPAFIFGRKEARAGLVAPASAAMLAVTVVASLATPPADAAEPDLNAVMTRNAQVTKVIDSTSDATFRLINQAGQERVRKVFSTTRLDGNNIDNMRMTRFTAPPDVKGTVTLLKEHAEGDDDIWIYLPALKKVRRLVSSNKKDSFVGTDFSYADVIGYKVGEWHYKLLREEAVDGQACYVIEATPKSEEVKTNTGYGKRIDWIRKDNAMTLRSDYWDAAGQPLKTTLFTNLEQVDPGRNKWQAMQLEARNLQTGHRTVISFSNFKTNQNVKSDYFTTPYMERE